MVKNKNLKKEINKFRVQIKETGRLNLTIKKKLFVFIYTSITIK